MTIFFVRNYYEKNPDLITGHDVLQLQSTVYKSGFLASLTFLTIQ
jgi:hypothetical protein